MYLGELIIEITSEVKKKTREMEISFRFNDVTVSVMFNNTCLQDSLLL